MNTKALLWKDYRLNRLAFGLGLVLLLAPYAVLISVRFYVQGTTVFTAKVLAEILATAAIFSLGLSQMTLFLLGGNSVACERADRSAEFLAYLPPSRLAIITSKAILIVIALAVIWGTNLLAIFGVGAVLGIDEPAPMLEQTNLPLMGAAGLLGLGVGWLASSLLESPSFATAAGFGTIFILWNGLVASHLLAGWPANMEGVVQANIVGGYLFGPLFFLTGIIYFVRRVEP